MAPESPVPADLLRHLPSVDQVIGDPGVRQAGEGLPQRIINDIVRRELANLRSRILGNGSAGECFEGRAEIYSAAVDACQVRLRTALKPQITSAINATGIIIHTGMGRSPLAASALEAVVQVSSGYCDVAISKSTGGRRSRSSGVEELLRLLTGCEAALVTNNNAAATMLALHTLAPEQEVIVSRGQLVEIGGSFRLPEVMTSAGARLREVGTTNRTRIEDYEKAIGEDTGALMRIHPSNFQIVGFTESVETAALVDLGSRRGLPVIDDIGSGALIDLSTYGLKGETPARASVSAGADLVLFSGDKLLGGPQAGILIGKKIWIERCAKNPLMRALRVDKMTIAALEATLRLYLQPEKLESELPLLRMISRPMAELRACGEALLKCLRSSGADLPTALEDIPAYVGGGSLPDEQLESLALVVECENERAEGIKRRLRQGDPSVFCRVRHGRLEFDLRTLQDAEIEPLADALVEAWGE